MNFVYSRTDKEEGTSRVTVYHRGKNYFGKARLNPEDEWSEFTGCRYAEIRAEIAALKDEYKQKKAACDECIKFVKAVQQYKLFDAKEVSSKMIFRQLNRRIREVNKLGEEITRREFALKVAIRQQDKMKTKIKND